MELLIINCSRKKVRARPRREVHLGLLPPASEQWYPPPPPKVLCMDPWSKIAGFGAAKGIIPRAEGPW